MHLIIVFENIIFSYNRWLRLEFVYSHKIQPRNDRQIHRNANKKCEKYFAIQHALFRKLN